MSFRKLKVLVIVIDYNICYMFFMNHVRLHTLKVKNYADIFADLLNTQIISAHSFMGGARMLDHLTSSFQLSVWR